MARKQACPTSKAREQKERQLAPLLLSSLITLSAPFTRSLFGFSACSVQLWATLQSSRMTPRLCLDDRAHFQTVTTVRPHPAPAAAAVGGPPPPPCPPAHPPPPPPTSTEHVGSGGPLPPSPIILLTRVPVMIASFRRRSSALEESRVRNGMIVWATSLWYKLHITNRGCSVLTTQQPPSVCMCPNTSMPLQP